MAIESFSRKLSDASVHHEANVVALEKDAPDRTASLLLDLNLLRVIYNQIHVLIESQDAPFDSKIRLLVQPNLHPRAVLQVPKNLIDRESHDLLKLFVAERHGWFRQSRRGGSWEAGAQQN
eukprot:TRINITY_DN347_c0_g3_i2.p1 TRINITY_DN347_c0_g3~~TRINITY_DN347_c0_g3_i2.p1  ORF type:complete len:121 (-),score=10.97 TRINITY_DN347_c0_g3_i2:25-387(-)